MTTSKGPYDMLPTKQQLELPFLNYPFAPERHSSAELVDVQMTEWLSQHNLLDNKKLAFAIRHGRFGDFAAREYPSATDYGLQLITYVFGWIFTFDDFIADCGFLGKHPGELCRIQLWLRETMDAPRAFDRKHFEILFFSNYSSDQATFLKKLGNATADLWGRLEDFCSATQYMRCVEAASYYFLGLVWEARWHEANKPPTPNEYLSGRKFTTACPFGLALQDVAARYEVPSEEYQSTEVRKLIAITSGLVGHCNDIFSFPKERDEPHTLSLNYPATLIFHQGLDAQEAINLAADLHNQLMEEYLHLERICSQHASMQCLRFLDAMRSKMRGHYDWALNSPRYALSKHYANVG